MRDLNSLRRRLLVAMGVTALSVSCGTDTSGTGTPADTSDAGVASVDTAGGDDTAGGADAAVDTSAPDTGVPDTGASDTGASDTGASDSGASDAGPADVAQADTAASDTAASDTAASDATASDTVDAGGPLPKPTCSNGQGSVQCFTAKQLKYNVDLAFMKGGPIPDDKVDFPLPPEGCPPADRVYEGCCNKAVSGPSLAGETCCYGFCVGACCGRPLMRDGEALLAPPVARADWYGAPSVAAARAGQVLSPAARAAIADAWREDARMEHASVASFNRFSLQLLSVGAPADLVHGAQRAALDEVDHAERCFGVLAAVGGVAEGPGPLDLTGLAPLGDLATAAAEAAQEGCVGETLAALLARARAQGCTVPAVRESLTLIADDEARHAELAWRFVRWTVERGGEPVRARLRRAFREALEAPPTPRMPAAVPASDWEAWGLLRPERHQRTVRAGLRQVIGPCVDALLGEPLWQELDRCA